jgi:sigma-E factor negative regulatory protein RseB
MSLMASWRVACGLGLLELCACASTYAKDAHEWWMAMNDAMVQKTYQVEVIHQANGRVERIKMWHRIRDGRVEEHWLIPNGHGREIVRTGAEFKVILPAQHTVLVRSGGNEGNGILSGIPSLTSEVDDHYSVELLKDTPLIFGRSCVVLSIRPKDGYRYGYRLTIDAQNELPVRSELLDQQGQTLEQWMFAGVQVGAGIDEQSFKSTIDVNGFQSKVLPAAQVSPVAGALPIHSVAHLPPGFTVKQISPLAQDEGYRLSISDGLANVTVFLEQASLGPWSAQRAEGQVGAARVYSESWAGHKLTVVGEVPRLTLAAVADAMREDDSVWQVLSASHP